MANEEHLGILKQGVKPWNEWREEHSEIRPDLKGADLRDADLQEANLRGANLSKADFSKADLSSAKLYKANLSGATFFRAKLFLTDLNRANLRQSTFEEANLGFAMLNYTNLTQANLSKTDLFQADFIRANLFEANLFRANFSSSFFRETDFTQAQIGRTTFGDVDLSQVLGLETVKHRRPSVIGIDTIYRSQGNIPKAFLRDAGVDDTFIEYIHSLVGSPIQYFSCFISYSSRDEDFAQRLYTDLQRENVRCWYAPEDLKIGDKFWHRIDESIGLYDLLLVVLSEHSVESSWVEREVMAALEKEQLHSKTAIFPIKLDERVMQTALPWAANIRRSRHIGDFRRWKEHAPYQKAFNRLLRDLKAE